MFTDRSALAREAQAALGELPLAEEEDCKPIVQVLASRLRGAIDDGAVVEIHASHAMEPISATLGI